MAVTLTLEEFRQFHPEVNAPDVVIQAYIEYVQEFIDAGVCWSDNMTKIIGYNLIAHFVTLSSGRRVSSQRAPNGAAQTYDLGKEGNGLFATSYGRLAMQLDTCGSLSGIIDTGTFIGAIGGRNAPR